MAPRLAVLIAALLAGLGGCERAGGTGSRTERCSACHAAQHAAHFEQLGSCTSCHRGDPSAERQALAHHRLITGRAAEHGVPDAPAVEEGRGAVERLACRRCHTIAGAGNRLGTDLDRMVWTRDQVELARSIAEPVENMPRFGLDPSQIEAVVAYLLSSADPGLSAPTYRVRFARREGGPESRFEAHCGGCHQALTAAGPRGRGSAGPNLSGLFTRFYPATAPENRPWTPAALAMWLENPRALRPRTTMRPVRLDEGLLRELVDELDGGEAMRSGGSTPTRSRERIR